MPNKRETIEEIMIDEVEEETIETIVKKIIMKN